MHAPRGARTARPRRWWRPRRSRALRRRALRRTGHRACSPRAPAEACRTTAKDRRRRPGRRRGRPRLSAFRLPFRDRPIRRSLHRRPRLCPWSGPSRPPTPRDFDGRERSFTSHHHNESPRRLASFRARAWVWPADAGSGDRGVAARAPRRSRTTLPPRSRRRAGRHGRGLGGDPDRDRQGLRAEVPEGFARRRSAQPRDLFEGETLAAKLAREGKLAPAFALVVVRDAERRHEVLEDLDRHRIGRRIVAEATWLAEREHVITSAESRTVLRVMEFMFRLTSSRR